MNNLADESAHEFLLPRRGKMGRNSELIIATSGVCWNDLKVRNYF